MSRTPILLILLISYAACQGLIGGYETQTCEQDNLLESPMKVFPSLDQTLKRMLDIRTNSEVSLLHYVTQVVAGQNYRVILKTTYDYLEQKSVKYIAIELYVPLPYTREQPDVTRMIISQNIDDVLGFFDLSKSELAMIPCKVDLKADYSTIYNRIFADKVVRMQKGKQQEDLKAEPVSSGANNHFSVQQSSQSVENQSNRPMMLPRGSYTLPAYNLNVYQQQANQSKFKLSNLNGDAKSPLNNGQTNNDPPFLAVGEFDPNVQTLETINPNEIKVKEQKTSDSPPNEAPQQMRKPNAPYLTAKRQNVDSAPGSYNSFRAYLPSTAFPNLGSTDFIFGSHKHTALPYLDSNVLFGTSSRLTVNNGASTDLRQQSYTITGIPDPKDPSKMNIKGAYAVNNNGQSVIRLINSTIPNE